MFGEQYTEFDGKHWKLDSSFYFIMIAHRFRNYLNKFFSIRTFSMNIGNDHELNSIRFDWMFRENNEIKSERGMNLNLIYLPK